MANISAFRASMRHGMARPNTFRVDLNFPSFVSGSIASSVLGQFHCKAASLPSSNIAHVPVFYQGRAVNVAGEREFEPWTVSIYNENFEIRDSFERWMDGINNLKNNTGLINPMLYQVDMQINQLDRSGSVTKKVNLIDAMPIAISPIQLDFEANNQIEIFEVTFVYNTYESSGVNTDAAGNLANTVISGVINSI